MGASCRYSSPAYRPGASLGRRRSRNVEGLDVLLVAPRSVGYTGPLLLAMVTIVSQRPSAARRTAAATPEMSTSIQLRIQAHATDKKPHDSGGSINGPTSSALFRCGTPSARRSGSRLAPSCSGPAPKEECARMRHTVKPRRLLDRLGSQRHVDDGTPLDLALRSAQCSRRRPPPAAGRRETTSR